MDAKMKNNIRELTLILLLISILLCCKYDIASGQSCYIDNLDDFAPIQLDIYKDQILYLGYDWQYSGRMSLLVKKVKDTVFKNITCNIDLELSSNSKVHFDNFGNIWAFGKKCIWKFENENWKSINSPPELLQNREFRDFCFDKENNIIVSVWIGFERYRETINGTVYVVYDSSNNEIIKITHLDKEVEYKVIKKFSHHPKYQNGAIQTIAKSKDGSIVCSINEETNNLIYILGDSITYKSLPFGLNGYSTKLTSMTFDNNNNMWLSVIGSSNQFLDGKPISGIHKITQSGEYVRWDSSDGLRGDLFQKHRFDPNLKINKISVNEQTGLIWCAFDFGFFFIDENKPRKSQITFYNRDSVSLLDRFVYYPTNVSFSDNEFKIVDILQYESNSYFTSQTGYVELIVNDSRLTVLESNSYNDSSLEIYPVPNFNSLTILLHKNINSNEGTIINIVDLLGNSLLTLKVESSINTIQIPVNTSSLTNGVYLVIVQNKDNIISKQFVIKK